MNSEHAIDKVKNAFHFLHELRDLEAKYEMRITSVSKSPTLEAHVNIITNVDDYEIGASCEDVRPLYDVTLEEI